MWQNHGILNPGGCEVASPNTFANALNAAGDVCGYGNGPVPLAWPDGAFSDSGSSTLSIPGFTIGYASDMNTISTIIGYAYSGTTVHTFRWTKSGGTWPLQTTEDLNAPAGGQAYAYSITENGRTPAKPRSRMAGHSMRSTRIRVLSILPVRHLIWARWVGPPVKRGTCTS